MKGAGEEDGVRVRRAIVVPIVALALAGACGGSGGEGGVSGTVNVSGSSTVEPISIAVAELLADAMPDVVVNVDGPGTGDGFELFCQGETAVSDASRPIKDEEIADCAANGVEFIELKIAFDGISVLTSPENDAVDCLTFADLYALVGPESQGVDRWREAQPLAQELGSSTRLPRRELRITAPGEESGTYDSFVEIVIEPIAEERGADPVVRKDYQASGDDNVIIQGIEGGPGTLGWVGFAFAEQAGDDVREVPVAAEEGDPCVAPSATTIADGSYPIARPLFVYVNAGMAARQPGLVAYIDHYLSDEGIISVEDVGYVMLPPDQLAETRAVWTDRSTGRQPA